MADLKPLEEAIFMEWKDEPDKDILEEMDTVEIEGADVEM